MLLIGMGAQATAEGIGAGDRWQLAIAVITLILVIWFFGYEQRSLWWPFALLSSRRGESFAEDHRIRERIEIGDAEAFTLKIEPRIGGPCSHVSAMFLSPPTWLQRFRRRNRVLPLAHYVSPDVISVESLVIKTPHVQQVGIRGKTTEMKEVFRLDPPVMVTPYEPLTCVVVARIRKHWQGQFSVRLTLAGVGRGGVAVPVEAKP